MKIRNSQQDSERMMTEENLSSQDPHCVGSGPKQNNFTKLNKQSTMLYLNHHPSGVQMDHLAKPQNSFRVPRNLKQAQHQTQKTAMTLFASKTQASSTSILTNETVQGYI
jgi:hypothetical protein